MIGVRSAPRVVGCGPMDPLRGAYGLPQQNDNSCTQLTQNMLFLFFYFSLMKVSEDTRSAWRYCNTRATLGQGAAQAPQDPSHGLNNSLKLM